MWGRLALAATIGTLLNAVVMAALGYNQMALLVSAVSVISGVITWRLIGERVRPHLFEVCFQEL